MRHNVSISLSFSIVQDLRSAITVAIPWLLTLWLSSPQSVFAVTFPDLSFSAESVERENVLVKDVHGETLADGTFRVSAESVEHENVFVKDAQVELLADGDFRISAVSIEHENGLLEGLQGDLRTDGVFRVGVQRAVVDGWESDFTGLIAEGAFAEGIPWDGPVVFQGKLTAGAYSAGFEFAQRPGEVVALLRAPGQELMTLLDLPGAPAQAGWLRGGSLDVEFSYIERDGATPQLSLRLDIEGLGFDSPDGRFAGEGLASKLEMSATLDQWSAPRVEGTILGGELLVDDFYRNFAKGGMKYGFSPAWNDNGIQIRSFRITDDYSLTVEGNAGWDFDDSPEPWRLEVNRLDLQFPGAYDRYIEPMVAALTLDGLGITGQVSWSGQWNEGQFRSGDLGITDLSIVDTQRNRFAFTGLEARMRPGDYSFDSKLSWRGLLMGRINLGPGEFALDSEPGKFAIVHPLVLEVLGGEVLLHELAVQLPGGSPTDDGEPDIRLRMDLEDLDMEQLTIALDWPLFSGKISGNIPGVSLDDGVLDVEGEISVSVFDGSLSLSDLRVERLFGVLPSLAGNIEAVNLDLEQLTSTFSFGQISGRVDGHIRDLRMLDWKPVAFDAWFGTPASQRGSRGISRKAVNNLTTLGGGSATTALTSPVMKLFSSFSYKALGLGCLMQNNVCEIRGVSDDGESVLIMEGAGVPKITIKAFNRRVDWPQLLAQLVSASEGDSVRVGD